METGDYYKERKEGHIRKTKVALQRTMGTGMASSFFYMWPFDEKG